jgi:hypothetical protein
MFAVRSGGTGSQERGDEGDLGNNEELAGEIAIEAARQRSERLHHIEAGDLASHAGAQPQPRPIERRGHGAALRRCCSMFNFGAKLAAYAA